MVNSPNKTKTCSELVWTNGGWHHKRCSKPAKFVCEVVRGFGHPKCRGYRCGIHAKKHKILEPYTADAGGEG